MMQAVWEPSFDACSVEQERLVQEFVAEIAGPRGQKGSPPDPVRLLEMAQALYLAEVKDLGPKRHDMESQWVLVPIDPTPEMLAPIAGALDNLSDSDRVQALLLALGKYRSVIAATPKATP